MQVIIHSVLCFTLLLVCVLHSLYVCLEGHSAPHPTSTWSLHSLSMLVISPFQPLLQFRVPCSTFRGCTSFLVQHHASHSVSGLMGPEPWEQDVVACCESVSKKVTCVLKLLTLCFNVQMMMTNRSFNVTAKT